MNGIFFPFISSACSCRARSWSECSGTSWCRPGLVEGCGSRSAMGRCSTLLFHIALWHLNLGYFDRNPIDTWPQSHTGVVLWSLSASASDWMDRERLTRLCTAPVVGVLESEWDLGSSAMESRILRPLTWVGLLETRWEGKAGLGEPRLYRKTPLFDHFLKFNVQIERPTMRH